MTDQQAGQGGGGSPARSGYRSLTLMDLIRVPMRRRVIVAVGVIVGALLGWLLSNLSGQNYSASATVVVRPVVTDPFTYPNPGAERSINMNVERGIAQGSEVVEAVAAATGSDVESVGEALEVEVPVGSQVLRFVYSAASAQAAALGADTAAASYLTVRGAMFQRQKQELLASYDESITRATQQRDEIAQQLPGTATSGTVPRVSGLLDGIRSLNDQLNQLNQHRARILSVDTSPGIKTSSPAAGTPASPIGRLLMIFLGTAIGLIVAALAAYAREAVDRRVRSARDASEATSLPMLGEVRRNASRAVGLVDSGYLALAVGTQLDQVNARRLAVLTARDGEGGTRVAAELAVMLAKEGLTVHVRDGADREDELRTRVRALAAPSGNGLAAPLGETRGKASTAAPATVNGDSADTAVIPVTPAEDDQDTVRVGSAARLADGTLRVETGSVRIGSSIDMSDDKDLTIVNAAPAESDVDGVRAASGAAALIVVARDRSRVAEVQRLVDRVRLTGGTPLGFVYVSRHD